MTPVRVSVRVRARVGPTGDRCYTTPVRVRARFRVRVRARVSVCVSAVQTRLGAQLCPSACPSLRVRVCASLWCV